VADAKGKVVFDRAKGYKPGVYAVVLKKSNYFEFLVNEPEVVMETDTTDLTGHLVVKRSAENVLFLDYIRFITDQRKSADQLAKEAPQDSLGKAGMKKRFQEIDKQVNDYQAALVAKAPNTLAALIVKMSMAVKPPEVKRADGSVDSLASYYDYRRHFWDNTDLTDERILRTPVFQNKFEEYIGKVVPQIPDTINKWADDLVHRMDHGDELFKFAVHSITAKYENSKIMGMDAVFGHMILTYYAPDASGKTRAFWMAKDKLDLVVEGAKKAEAVLIGKQAMQIILPDTTEEKWIDYYRLPQEYVLLVFWDPHCGHCKKELPELAKVYKEKLKPMGIEVFAVAHAADSVLFHDWKAFIKENDLNWVNVGLPWHVYNAAKADPGRFIPKITTLNSLNYATAWDIETTPRMFLVDADRKIIAKQLDGDQIVDLVTTLRKRKAAAPKP
jgi:thiol-disulfide isomerase/thioredoxin